MNNSLLIMYSIQKSIMAGAFLAAAINVSAQKEEAIKYGDFEQWITRNIKESSVIGGETKHKKMETI